MELVGHDDLQGRSAYQPTIHQQRGRVIAYVGHHGGRARNPLTGRDEDNGTSIVDATDPSKPRLEKTIGDFVAKSGGVVGPHTLYAMPGRMMITGLSNHKDHGGATALVEYSNKGEYVATHWIPTKARPGGATIESVADGYGYDVRVLPRRNVMLTSSFTGWSNYMMDFGTMLQDAEAMKRFGQTVVVWDLHARQPRSVLNVPGAPLEIRFAWGARSNYAFTSTALTSKLWLIREENPGVWKAKAVADIGDPAKVPLPVDISDPDHPKQVYEKKIGSQLNMVSQSWDGKRVYFTSSLLANWDKKGKDDEQFLKAYNWDGKELTPAFAIDFYAEKLGRPHIMHFGAASLYGKTASAAVPTGATAAGHAGK